MSDQEKLQAIKDQSRREQAQRAQAEIADKRKSGRKKPERFALWVALALIVGVANLYFFLSKEPEQPDRSPNYAELANTMNEYNRSAFRLAAVRELKARGIYLDNPEAVTSERLSAELFVAYFRSEGQSYRLRGNYICESLELISEKRKNPACYFWE